MILLLLLAAVVASVSGQMALLYDLGQRTPNCPIWSDFGPCIWFNRSPSNSAYSKRWGRNYRDQLGPQCYRHRFYQRAEVLYGGAIRNVMDYFSSVISDTKPCGMCSYQQSCGSGNCNQRKYGGKKNSIFIAERLCQPSSLNGHKQNLPCTANAVTSTDGACKIWPPPKSLVLPHVSELKKELLYYIEVASCVTVQASNGSKSCKCCCFPFKPNYTGTKCLLNHKYRHLAPPGWELNN